METLIDQIIDKVNVEQIKRGRPLALYELREILVQLLDQRRGHWIEISNGVGRYKCDQCGAERFVKDNFCSSCGANLE